MTSVENRLLLILLVWLASARMAAGQQPKHFERPLARLEPSVVLRQEGDYQQLEARMRQAAKLGCRHINFVITVNCEISHDDRVLRYGLAKRVGRDLVFQPMTDEIQERLLGYFRKSVNLAVMHKMKIAILCHLDGVQQPYVWRNYFQFDPLEKYDGYSYQTTMIEPLIRALSQQTPPRYEIDFSIAGEMGTSVFQFPTSYEQLVDQTRRELADKRLAVGVSFNFNNVQGRHEPVESPNLALQKMIGVCDFIGLSNYHEVSVPPTADDFQKSIESFAADLADNGVRIPDDARLHFSEIGAGGYGKQGFTNDPNNAAIALYEGTQNPRRSPWADTRMRTFRRKYHQALLEFLTDQSASWPVEVAFLWSEGSWDPQGMDQAAFADEQIMTMIREHNKQQAHPPNILLVMTDDQGWGDIGRNGNEVLSTPNLDRFADQGAMFERFFVSPVCAPTRASLLTGRYYLRTGVHGVTRGRETMRADELTLAEHLNAAGYATGCFGKWHNGAHYPHDPLAQGFDQFVGFCGGHWNNYFDTKLQYQRQTRQTHGYIADVLTDAAIDFMRKNHAGPFFCYVPLNTPHSPFQAPEEEFTTFKSQGLNDKLACIYAMCQNIDTNFGRMLAALVELGLEDSTIVVFLTDNGPNSVRFNGGLPGKKASVREGGVRVPCFVRWPGKIPKGTVVQQVSAAIDLFPTLLGLAGITAPEDRRIDGMNLSHRLLNGRDTEVDASHRLIFSHHVPALSEVRDAPGAVRTHAFTAVRLQHGWQLFDTRTDPRHSVDVAGQFPGELDKLKRAYRDWFDSVTANGFDRIPIEIGHRVAPRTELPAHEAELRPGRGNGISYSDQMGWAHAWITDWVDSKATARWPIRSVEKGVYDVYWQAACPPSWVGRKMRIDVPETSIEWEIAEPIRAPQVAGPDRVRRGESFERRWKLERIGELFLPVGDFELVLGFAPSGGTGANLPHNESMDIKTVILELRAGKPSND